MNKIKGSYVLIFFFLLIYGCAPTKVFPPSDTYITPRTGFLENEKINVSFFDSRNDKAHSLEIRAAIYNHLKSSYPSSLVVNDDAQYFKDPLQNEITIKIVIAGYSAGFGAKSTSGIGSVNGQTFIFNGVADGRWNGLTGIAVNLYDYRKDEEKKWTGNLSKVISKPNTGGYTTAQKALKESFQNVMDQLCLSIDQRLMK